MEVKGLFVLVLVALTINMSSARTRRIVRRGPCQPNITPTPCQCPPESVYFSNLATPFPAVIETIDYIPNFRQPCSKQCNDQLILPPVAAELPCGLGYLPSALPLVAKCFAPSLDYLTTGAYLPTVSSSCDCLTLMAPVSPDLAPLVKPIIL